MVDQLSGQPIKLQRLRREIDHEFLVRAGFFIAQLCDSPFGKSYTRLHTTKIDKLTFQEQAGTPAGTPHRGRTAFALAC
jgi:hypothetical protein